MSLYASVCNNTVVMWPLFIELIVSFNVKITQKIFVTQGISFWLECGHPAYGKGQEEISAESYFVNTFICYSKQGKSDRQTEKNRENFE